MKNEKKSKLKIAILSNFTIKGLKEEIEKRCKDILINVKIYEGGYKQINQEFLDEKSGLKKFEPEITFLVINNQFIIKESEINIIQNKEERVKYVNNKINEFIQIVNFFLDNISGVLVMSNLKQTSYSPLGINEDNVEFSIKDWINYFNDKIKSEFIKEDRIRIYDLNSFFHRFGENNIINDKLRYLGDIYISPEYISYLSEDLMGYIKPFVSKNRKCIVLDLDNTLWGGIVGEDGFNNIKLDDKPPGNTFLEFQKYLFALYKCGIILAINSKNNPEDALKVIREHPYMILREEHFACIKINWQNKVNNMIEIAQEINIGLDSLVFIDDDSLNRELVKENLPEVLVIDLPKDSSLYVRTLKSLNDFNTLQLTEEDYKKGEMYSHQRQRNELKRKITNMDDFLKSLNVQVEIALATDFTIPRISQLTKKTNQFNLTTKRYTEENIKKFNGNPNYYVYGVNVKDKFGDNGLTGVIILNKNENKLIIDTILLSCRIIGRNVEKIMLYFIQEFARKNDFSKIIGEYVPTEKNSVCSDFYIENGFDVINQNLFKLKDFNKIRNIDYIKTLMGDIYD